MVRLISHTQRVDEVGGDTGGRGPRASNPQKFFRPPKKAFLGRNLRMAQSRRHERPRSSRLQHSASFRTRNPNKASMTLMLAAASSCAIDALERQLAPPGFQCCERELLGRSWRRDWAMRSFRHFSGTGKFSRSGSFFPDWMLGVRVDPMASPTWQEQR